MIEAGVRKLEYDGLFSQNRGNRALIMPCSTLHQCHMVRHFALLVLSFGTAVLILAWLAAVQASTPSGYASPVSPVESAEVVTTLVLPSTGLSLEPRQTDRIPAIFATCPHCEIQAPAADDPGQPQPRQIWALAPPPKSSYLWLRPLDEPPPRA